MSASILERLPCITRNGVAITCVRTPALPRTAYAGKLDDGPPPGLAPNSRAETGLTIGQPEPLRCGAGDQVDNGHWTCQ